MRVYLDMCTIQRPLDDRSQLRVHLEAEAVLGILTRCSWGLADLLDSDALRFEMDRNPYPMRRMFTEAVLSTAADLIEATEAVEARALRYRAAGMKQMDALHLASAVAGEADYFCTCDDKLLRRARNADTGTTRAVSALELVQEIER